MSTGSTATSHGCLDRGTSGAQAVFVILGCCVQRMAPLVKSLAVPELTAKQGHGNTIETGRL